MKKLFLIIFFVVATVNAQTRAYMQTEIDAIATGVPNTALKIRTVLNTIANGTAQTGDVKEIDVTNAYIATNFDVTGLGKNDRLGWAICNGNNGTRNRQGRIAMQYSATYPTMGAIGGEYTHTLTIDEMPSHSHDMAGDRNESHDSGTYVIGGGTVNDRNPVTKTTGGSQAHNNMQPYIVTLFIMKL